MRVQPRKHAPLSQIAPGDIVFVGPDSTYHGIGEIHDAVVGAPTDSIRAGRLISTQYKHCACASQTGPSPTRAFAVRTHSIVVFKLQSDDSGTLPHRSQRSTGRR